MPQIVRARKSRVCHRKIGNKYKKHDTGKIRAILLKLLFATTLSLIGVSLSACLFLPQSYQGRDSICPWEKKGTKCQSSASQFLWLLPWSCYSRLIQEFLKTVIHWSGHIFDCGYNIYLCTCFYLLRNLGSRYWHHLTF